MFSRRGKLVASGFLTAGMLSFLGNVISSYSILRLADELGIVSDENRMIREDNSQLAEENKKLRSQIENYNTTTTTLPNYQKNQPSRLEMI